MTSAAMIGTIASLPEVVEVSGGGVGLGEAALVATAVTELGAIDGSVLDSPVGVGAGVAGTSTVNVHCVRSRWPPRTPVQPSAGACAP
jgi:hypothetical protein